MKNTKTYLVIGLATLFCSCNVADNISDEERRTITREIQDRMNGYPEAMKRKDIDWFKNFWSNESDFVFAGDGEIKTNYDSAITKAYLDAFVSIKEVIHLNWTNGHATVLSKDVVSYTTNFDWAAVTVSGDTSKSRGSWLYLFKKAEGTWRVVNSAGTHITADSERVAENRE